MSAINPGTDAEALLAEAFERRDEAEIEAANEQNARTEIEEMTSEDCDELWLFERQETDTPHFDPFGPSPARDVEDRGTAWIKAANPVDVEE